MTEKKILTSNKLIAEFDEETFYSSYPGCYTKFGLLSLATGLEECKYHSSWDWIMPVVAKCSKLFDEAYLHDNGMDDFFWDHYHEGKYFIMEYPSIKETYKDVVKLIKWYNKQKKV